MKINYIINIYSKNKKELIKLENEVKKLTIYFVNWNWENNNFWIEFYRYKEFKKVVDHTKNFKDVRLQLDFYKNEDTNPIAWIKISKQNKFKCFEKRESEINIGNLTIKDIEKIRKEFNKYDI